MSDEYKTAGRTIQRKLWGKTHFVAILLLSSNSIGEFFNKTLTFRGENGANPAATGVSTN
ncbi:hypothetical protein TUM4442_15380 [Shewanella algae]|nr:hypothetical protein TUM4442_15380 [Shewanella algae]